MASRKVRRGGGPGRFEAELRGLWIILMLDAVLALAKKLVADDATFTEELAALEQAKKDYEAQREQDQAAFTALTERVSKLETAVSALGAPVDTSTFATKADVEAINGELDELNTAIAGLTSAPGSTTGPAPGSNPITVDASQIPTGGNLGEAFAGNVAAAGGSGPLTFVIDSGKLPDGLAMAAGGAITGVPTVAGDFTCDVAVSDANGDVGHATVEITVVDPAAPAPAPVEPEA